MVSATLTHDTLLPRAPGGQGLGAVLSLAAHGLLLAGMVTVVQWRTQAPEVVIAELWSGVPEAAAPPAAEAPPPVPRVAPEPAPPTPAPAPTPAEPPPQKVDIATERAEKERAERERREAEAARRKQEAEKARAETEKLKREEAERKAREKREKREEAEAAERLQQQRAANLARMQAQAGTGTGTGSAASAPGPGAPSVRGAAPSASYKGRLVAVIRSNLTFGGDVPGNPVAEVRVRATASGTILSRVLVKSSGHAAWDNAVLAAIDKTGTLPRDTDGRVPSEMIVAFRPKE